MLIRTRSRTKTRLLFLALLGLALFLHLILNLSSRGLNTSLWHRLKLLSQVKQDSPGNNFPHRSLPKLRLPTTAQIYVNYNTLAVKSTSDGALSPLTVNGTSDGANSTLTVNGTSDRDENWNNDSSIFIMKGFELRHSGARHTKEESFQSIDNRQAWMYSAFYDHVAASKGQPRITAFGLAYKAFLKTVYCLFPMKGDTVVSMGKVKALPDSHQMGFLPCVIDCRLEKGVHPEKVSFTFKMSLNATNQLRVLYSKPRTRNITVCYSILHSQYNMTSLLIQSIEMNRLLGAEHFLVYNHSVSNETAQILSWYQAKGLMTVLQWPIPTLKTWYFSQMTAVNDCFYRNRNVSQFVALVDTDEIIVIKENRTWLDFIKSRERLQALNKAKEDQATAIVAGNNVSQILTKKQPSKLQGKQKSHSNPIGSFLFRSTIFDMSPSANNANTSKQWMAVSALFSFPDDQKRMIQKCNVELLSLITRWKTIFPYENRSKIIARPERVRTVGIHFVHKYTGKFRTENIGKELALVHHYRLWPQNYTVIDTSVFRFRDPLYARLKTMFSQFPHIFHCMK